MSKAARIRALEERVAALEAGREPSVAPAPVVLAHIMSPATKLDEARRGQKPAALCGAVIAGDSAKDSPVCRTCFDLNVKRQETEAATWMSTSQEAGRVQGERQGIATGAERERQAIREAAERRASALAAAATT